MAFTAGDRNYALFFQWLQNLGQLDGDWASLARNTHITWASAENITIAGEVNLVFLTTSNLRHLSHHIVLLWARHALRLMVLQGWFLLSLFHDFLSHSYLVLLLLILEHIDICLTIALKVVVRFFHHVVVHHEVVDVLVVLLCVFLVLFRLLADVVVCGLKIIRAGDIRPIVWICLNLIKTLTWILNILSLLNPFTSLGSMRRVSQRFPLFNFL